MSFKNLILSDKARIIFGKKEQFIIKKQLAGEKLSQSEKNRLSRDIRKKLDFIYELLLFKEEFALTHNQTNKRIIADSVKIILSQEESKNISAVILFGSYADNTFTGRSDIDMAVVFKNQISLKEATLYRKKTLSSMNSKVDLQVFNILPLKIKKEILKKGRVLYKKRFDILKEVSRNDKLYGELELKKHEFLAEA